MVDVFDICCIGKEDLDMFSEILPVYGRAINRGVILGITEFIAFKEPVQDIPAFPPSHSTFIAL